ncbi:MAG: glycosyltransferase family 4 protein [Desulfomonile tiedjei]|uniref:Glycosyltransferase family 4 protein n=1 Tax=Desulfomonile tiedjei TaxID=2358 RepID=A0A9D6V2E5_9BACT|nr:glycosyltransferase family 4 protein [Desulfomonile tiedjei]
MIVGLVIYGHLEIVTGGFLYDRMLVEHLRSCGDTVEIFPLPWRTYGRHLLDNASSRFWRALSGARLDVLLQDELNHPSLFIGNRLLKRNAGYPIVSIVHHLRCSEQRAAWKNRLYGIVERDYLSRVDGYVFNSATTRSTVEELIGSCNRSVIAYPGRDAGSPPPSVNRISQESLEPGPLRILFVGSLIQRKELHTLLMALARLPLDAWKLDVVGSLESDPDYVAMIHRIVETQAIGKNVRMLGVLDRQGLIERYGQNQFLAVPSSYEGFGIVYLEAMGFGLPCLAGNVGAAREIVTPGKDGFLVTPGNIDSIAGYVDQLIRDRDMLQNMSLAALDRYAVHPTWHDSAEKIRNFLSEMVK